MMKHVRVVLVVLAVFAAGCGSSSGPRLLRLHGNVSYQAKPIEKGQIEFVPVDGTPGPPISTEIVNGRYDIAAAHGGRDGGTYQVRITGLKKTGKTAPNILEGDSRTVELSENFIPSKYNRESTLRATITPEAVGKGFDFALQ